MSASNKHGERLARWTEEKRVGAPPRPAATVVPLRDGNDGLETLMLSRNSKIAFGGMWVFPGGRVDEADRVGSDERAGARRAAVRESFEEAGLAIEEGSLIRKSRKIN